MQNMVPQEWVQQLLHSVSCSFVGTAEAMAYFRQSTCRGNIPTKRLLVDQGTGKVAALGEAG
jgi:hypothetical protein